MSTGNKYIAFLGRVLIAALFLVSGFRKLLSPESAQQYISSAGLPYPEVIYWATVAVELIGGFCLLLGFFTRFWAYVLAIFSVTAAAALHTKFGDPRELFNFLKDVAIAGGLLQVAAFGTGDDLGTKTPRY
jgi:putative oxidoreductase